MLRVLFDHLYSDSHRLTDMEFLGPMTKPILGSNKFPISNISADILHIHVECGYQILVTKKCN